MRFSLLVPILIAMAGMSSAEQPQAAPDPATNPATPAVAPVPAPEVPPGGCLYRGKPRPSAWVDIQFVKFRDKIAKIDGTWRDCGKGIVDGMTVEISPPAPGTEIRSAPAGSKVLQIINPAEILAERPFSPGTPSIRPTGLVESRFLTRVPGNDGIPDRPQIVFHIRGIKSQGLTDGVRLTQFGFHYNDPSTLQATWQTPPGGKESSPPEEWLVYCGTHAYIATDGSQRTVPSYAVYRPATRDEFIEALASGLTLTDYVTETKTIRPPKVSKEKPSSVSQIVAKPVP